VLATAEASNKHSLAQLLADSAWRLKRIRIQPDQWDYQNIPKHLLPRLRVLDERGSLLATDQDLAKLKQQMLLTTKQTTDIRHNIEQGGLTDWGFVDLPESLEIHQGLTLLRYPAIQDDKNSVSVVLCDSPGKSRQISQNGYARLLMFRTAQQRDLILRQLRSLKQALGLKLVAQELSWQDNTLLAIYRLAFHLDESVALTKVEFEKKLAEHRSDLVVTADRVCRLLKEVYESIFELNRSLSLAPLATRQDVTKQLRFLVDDQFPASVDDTWLWEYPRYLKGLRFRLERAPFAQIKDDESIAVINSLELQYGELLKFRPGSLPEFPWLVQELRVSLFAQVIGTKRPVSAKKLAKLIDQARLGDIQ
jgi:ATP-dependent helicase HrpA